MVAHEAVAGLVGAAQDYLDRQDFDNSANRVAIVHIPGAIRIGIGRGRGGDAGVDRAKGAVVAVDAIIQTIFVGVGVALGQAGLGGVVALGIVAVGVFVIRCVEGIGVNRRQTGVPCSFIGVVETVVVTVAAAGCHITGRGLRFDVVGDAVVVAVQIQAIGNAVVVRINGERAFHIVEYAVTIVVGVAAIDHAVAVAVTVGLAQVVVAQEVVAWVAAQGGNIDLLTRVIGRHVERIIVFHQAYGPGAHPAILEGVHQDFLSSLPVNRRMVAGREVEREGEIVGAAVRGWAIGARGD